MQVGPAEDPTPADDGLLAHLHDAHSVEVTSTELRFFGTHSLPLDTTDPFDATAFHADLHERAISSPHEHANNGMVHDN